MSKRKAAGLPARTTLLLVSLFLLVGGSFHFFSTKAKIQQAEEGVATLTQQVKEQEQKNEELSDAIANSDNPEHQKDIARTELGLLEPGEKVFYITD